MENCLIQGTVILSAYVEMASLYGLSRYKYIEYLLEHRPSMDMSDEELEHFAPWDSDVQAACAKSGK